MKFKIGDEVQSVRIDHPSNNAYGKVVDINGMFGCFVRFEGDFPKLDGWYSPLVLLHDHRSWYKNLQEAPLRDSSVMLLSTDAKERKSIPMTTGVLDYFPLALAEVAKASKAGNEQHNPGQPLHWDKTKSTDHADCILRHLVDRGKIGHDGVRHSANVAWRALALLQLEMEAEQGKQ